MADPLVVVLHFGGNGSLGAARRVRSLSALFTGAGAHVEVINLRNEHPPTASIALIRRGASIVRGQSVPESLAWSLDTVSKQLRKQRPAVIICNTVRSFHPSLVALADRVVLDFVDQLSTSYRDRSAISSRATFSLALRALASTAARIEARQPAGVSCIAAGWTDARSLSATWVPITTSATSALPERVADHDLVFIGSLSYPPNIEAITRLAELWPRLRQRRPGCTVLVAGARPSPEVRRAATLSGWTLEEDFDDLGATLARARLSVVPLRHASGQQIKVLDAASYGMAQVVTPIAVAGFEPGFPVVEAIDDHSLINSIIELLDDDRRRHLLGERAREHVEQHYLDRHWTPWAARMLDGGPTR